MLEAVLVNYPKFLRESRLNIKEKNMSVVSAPLKNDIAMQKDLFRLAASIYSESSDVVSDSEIQTQIIRCMFVAKENEYLTKSEIISNLLDIYKYHISEDEVDAVIRQSRGVFQSVLIDECRAYCLTSQAYTESVEMQKNSIDDYIDQFIDERQISEPEKCKNAIHIYLYELTTTNINSYQVLLSGKDGTQFTSSELSVDVSELDDTEKQLVHDFLSWENTAKNSALGNLVYCCLEYCLLINGDSPNHLLNGIIKDRVIFLDTNIIFRALGINGESRKKVVIAFLNKCKQAKLKLIISHSTNKEFFDTISYYVSQMQHYPRGNIYIGAYEEISDYNIFAFFENWRQTRPNVSLAYFVSYIRSLYLKFVRKYAIDDDVKIPASIYHTDEFKTARNRYTLSINHVKQGIKDSYRSDDYSYSQRDSHDATVVRHIEILRENSRDKDIFLVSSDKALRLWDMNRTDADYPVVIYPSQLFLVLLKTCGRSENDYDSFVSFINIRPKSKQISPENANIILSGISSITEDIKTQEHLVAAVYSDEFQNVIKNSSSDMDLYEKVQRITQNYLDEELRKKEDQIQSLQTDVSQRGAEVEAMQERFEEQSHALEDSKRQIENQTEELKKKQEQIINLATSKIMAKYIWINYVLPILLALLVVFLVIFIGLQFICKDKEWNFAILFYEWIRSTYFGMCVGDFVYAIDGVFAGIVGYFLKKWMRNPFNATKKKKSKMDLVQKYIDDHQLN